MASSYAPAGRAIAGEMFGHSLLERSFKRRSRWPAVLAYCGEAIAVAMVLLAPILSSQGLPQLGAPHAVVPMGVISRPVAAPNSGRVRGPAVPVTPNMLIFTAHQSNAVRAAQPVGDNPDPASACSSAVGCGQVPGGPGGPGFFPPGLFPVAPAVVRPPVPPRSHPPMRLSDLDPGRLIHRVEPAYPPMAIRARVQGPVLLAALIARDGTIENLRVLSGNPMLAPAAVDAVRQWRYRPYVLDGEPVEVETQITVNFVLGQQ